MFYEEDPIKFWMRKTWWRYNKLFNINKRCNVFTVMTHKNKKIILFVFAKHFIAGKCLVRVTAFPTMQKHFYGEIFVQWCITIIVRGSLSSSASLWGPFSIVIYSSQVVQGISVRQNNVWRQWRLRSSCDRCCRTNRGQGEVSDKRRPTNYRKWDKRQS